MATKKEPKRKINQVQNKRPIIAMVKPPKQRPRGNPDATKPYRFSSKTPEDRARAAAASGLRKTFTGGKGKISEAMTAMLNEQIPEHLLPALGIDHVPNATWADAISFQTVKRAVGLIDGDKICFTAITELRETTEGKTPEKSEVAGAGGAPLAATPIQVNFIKAKKQESTSNEDE